IQKQNTRMCQGDFPGKRVSAASRQGLRRDRRMRTAKRPPFDQCPVFIQKSRHTVNSGKFYALFPVKPGKDCREPEGDHSFSSSLCTDKKNIMKSRRCGHSRFFGCLLTQDL